MFKLQLFFFRLLYYFFKIGYPFGIIKWADHKRYESLYLETIKNSYKDIDDYENKEKYKVDKEWLNNLAYTTQVVIKDSEINYQHGRVLYTELSKYINKIQTNYLNILETGTARGFSSLCMAKSLSDMKQKGRIFTIDILPHNKKIIWNCVEDINGFKTRQELLSKWSDLTRDIKFIEGKSMQVLNKIDINRVNFAFLDGAHNLKSVKFEYEWVKNRQKKNDIIIFDDYSSEDFSGIFHLVNQIEKDKIYNIKKLFSKNNRGYAIAVKH